MADSQVLRWIDELNGLSDGDRRAREIKAKIKAVRKGTNSLQNRKLIRKLYSELDEVQFKPDYMCLIVDRERDLWRACDGFSINGLTYHRLLGTNGGVKNETIVFISDKVGDEIRRRIDNGRDMTKELVPAKLEAYKALACSAAIPVSFPNGIILVNDCETSFVEDIVYLDDEADGEPVMEYRNGVQIELTESDGYGLMLPSLAQKWGEELGLDYIPGGVNTRCSWEKGMLYAFDFIDFGESVAKSYYIKDAWGTVRDIREAEVIMTTSMLKLWDSYSSMEDYLENCRRNKYDFAIPKVAPEKLENEHNLNYQFSQTHDLTDEEIDELISPTVEEIDSVLGGDYRKTVLYLKGSELNAKNAMRSEDDFAKAIMADQRMINDPYVQNRIYQTIKNRINEAKIGVLKVHGNYSMLCGDPYALCQSAFGLEVTGLLGAGEVYNDYWDDSGSEELVCFRAPMSCHANIRKVTVNRSPEARYWYRYMTSCTALNAWDSIAHALNGADKDGDLVFLTDNPVLVKKHRLLPVVMCVQRKAKKRVVTEEDAIQANINSFGDDIGKVTNRITSMFEVQSAFPKWSPEYKELDYRIMCGQLLQQNCRFSTSSRSQ